MNKESLIEIRIAYEQGGSNLEEAICEYLKPFGMEGIDLRGDTIPAAWNGIGEKNPKFATRLRCNGDTLEGMDVDDNWFAISVFKKPALYIASIEYMCSLLESL